MGVRVGIPRALWYYTYFPFWREFFTQMGATCVVSADTTKATLDRGIDMTVSEACVPIKVYFGHVDEMIEKWRAGKVDMLFLPRYVSWERSTVFCPKFLGLPDMVRHTWEEHPPLIAPRIDLRKRPIALLRACDQVRRQIGGDPRRLLISYHRAKRAQKAHEQRLAANWDARRSIAGHTKTTIAQANAAGTTETKPPFNGQRASNSYANPNRSFSGASLSPPSAPRTENGQPTSPTDITTAQDAALAREYERPIRLAVIGYPYLLYDNYVSLGVLEKLKALGAEVVSAEALEHRHPRPVRHWSKPLFWTFSSRVARAGVHALGSHNQEIDGVIHLTAFSCGPDAIVDKLLEIESQCPGAKPFLALGLDEQTGEAGCLTRLEAFVDMLRRRRALEAKSGRANQGVTTSHG